MQLLLKISILLLFCIVRFATHSTLESSQKPTTWRQDSDKEKEERDQAVKRTIDQFMELFERRVIIEQMRF